MPSIELTANQKMVLRTLTNLYKQSDGTVKGDDIADQADRNPGTIRNQMQSLKSLQLVEGIPGPKGGYKPTAAAYEALGIQQMDEPATVSLKHEGESEETIIEGITLSSVHHPELCRAEIHIQKTIDGFQEGEPVSVGPTPLAELTIKGVVDGKDDTNNVLILQIDEMVTEATGETPRL
ncbi:Rrf2 family transcriptional regulator [Natronococcus occultus]|uniref:Putative transcriptional regulator, contains C-terminal CBS domains n=1 Tax=Natronococcus occultus SP4 TaxID=694430 RepID=L0JXK9_9EURY|nr:Rrf2 family transcriptional regulator [Natronococcus occultus]AGB37040.1 putative transcriptional regulator, contains C-terminal CBS domains [Natronococcus occultus SP4]